ncbi:ATP-dependent helicase [Acidisphaera sp. L21]|uniref:ATP-dependent helicase n=1 Tax=Acidisphaera sp. L21 TaxID=1641851 RepID=UPI00131BE878|nr:ATP-dependent helicase [Acidisphaera sp. L21]
MDQFAIIRSRARKLRAAAGIPDSAIGAEAAWTAAAWRSLTVKLKAPDHPDLEGGHGQLDRGFATILIRDDLPDEGFAEVLAHEIGHYEIHDGPSPGYHPRSGKNGGDPMQRIETYGIKERREAQANAFAREFLLPRPLAKRLFVEGGTASGISAALRLRYETVIQQLADGLLLPDLPSVMLESRRPDAACDVSQSRAVAHRGGPFLLRAGPGTGKTKTLTARIASLLDEGVPGSGILALTFSNKAARELAERLQGAAGLKAVNVWTGTFHAFGLDTIRRHHALFGVSDDPPVVDPSEAVAMLEEALPALDVSHYLNLMEPALALRDILRAIARAKDELCSWEGYERLAEAMRRTALTDDDRLAAGKAREVALVYKHYQQTLAAGRAVDYGDLVMRPALLMRSDADFRDAIRKRFTHVHVDEYQDVNRASAKLVQEIVGEGRNLWVVGDARQSIYRFRGASAANVARFEADYPSGRRDGLEKNYRSSQEIVDLYTRFGGTMKVSAYAGDAALSAANGLSGRAPAMCVAPDGAGEMDQLAGSIRDLQSTGVELADQTVLARSNGALAKIADELNARGIPVLYLGPLFERPEVKDLLCVLSLVADDVGPGLLRAASLPEYGVPLEDALAVIQAGKATEQRVFDLLCRLEGVSGLSTAGREGLALLARHLQGMTRGTTPWLALGRYLFDASGYFRTVLSGQSPSATMRRVAVRQLIEALRQMPLSGKGSPIRRALDRVRHMILLADERDLRQLPAELEGLDGVRLMTVHASKGLEFDAVHMPGLFAGAIPAANRPPACPAPAGMIEGEESDAHEAEEECILFVAMSRARSHLRLYRPATRNGRNAGPSKFLERVPAAPGRSLRGLPRLTPVAAFPAITSPGAPDGLSASDIEGYSRCPRRFFYSRVLGLAARTRAGAYLDAHGCLQQVLAYVRGLAEGKAYDEARAQVIFDEAWARTELDQHPFGGAYRNLTLGMLGRLHRSAAGDRLPGGFLSTRVANEAIAIPVDRVGAENATVVLKTIRSGRLSKSDPDRLSATLMLKATREAFGASARVENHYLQDGGVARIDQTAAKFGKRVGDCEQAVADIRAGRFEPIKSDFGCPRCPFLFVCAVPGEPSAT